MPNTDKMYKELRTKRDHLEELKAEAEQNVILFKGTLIELAWGVTVNFLALKIIDVDAEMKAFLRKNIEAQLKELELCPTKL